MICLDSYRFLQRSRPDRVDVEVQNPDEERVGWYAPVTVIRTNVSERPFIVDTIREFLHAREYQIGHFVYPLLNIDRDAEGEIIDVRPSGEGGSRESLVHAEVARVMDSETHTMLTDECCQLLTCGSVPKRK